MLNQEKKTRFESFKTVAIHSKGQLLITGGCCGSGDPPPGDPPPSYGYHAPLEKRLIEEKNREDQSTYPWSL
ncbi:hypothetical protein [Microscilla marina]|uniref:Lipoprotein n=1 Tax=Microscilla marina ATCC 23134 TaxID=313606 RepID=A1ZNA1_MICM2|nr:hypothetical protein [Microscilla marina]EAY28282.1 hypothetical protein M23134_03543 [Microscilla marina ATCC 23134]